MPKDRSSAIKRINRRLSCFINIWQKSNSKPVEIPNGIHRITPQHNFSIFHPQRQRHDWRSVEELNSLAQQLCQVLITIYMLFAIKLLFNHRHYGISFSVFTVLYHFSVLSNRSSQKSEIGVFGKELG